MNRYDIETSIGEDWEAVERKDGEYVTFADHQATIATLAAELESMKTTNLILQEIIVELNEQHTEQ